MAGWDECLRAWADCGASLGLKGEGPHAAHEPVSGRAFAGDCAGVQGKAATHHLGKDHQPLPGASLAYNMEDLKV